MKLKERHKVDTVGLTIYQSTNGFIYIAKNKLNKSEK